MDSRWSEREPRPLWPIEGMVALVAHCYNYNSAVVNWPLNTSGGLPAIGSAIGSAI